MAESRIWFDRPAGNTEWNKALPIGCGRIGAMIFGNPVSDRLQINEESIWYGGPKDRCNPQARTAMPEIRSLIAEGRLPEAERQMRYRLAGIPQSERPFQPLGDCKFTFWNLEGQDIYEYRRELNLENAICTVSFKAGKVQYRRQYFSSCSSDCLFIICTASEPGQICFDSILTRERFYDAVHAVDDHTIALSGRAGTDGVDYELLLTVFSDGGTVGVQGENLVVTGADEAVVVINGGSTFRYVYPELFDTDAPSAWAAHAKENVRELEKTKLEEELMGNFDGFMKGCSGLQEAAWRAVKNHVSSYTPLFRSVQLELSKEEDRSSLPTDARLAALKEGKEDPGLVQTYFDFGRYLLISSGRGKLLPANLQGIWNESLLPPWDSKYTININTEMNYWPAEACGLDECMQPLWQLLQRLAVNGRKTAEELYGCRGFTAHHNTDLWADAAPQDLWLPATFWVMGGAWLCNQMYARFTYTGSTDWLEQFFPVLEQAVVFFEDFLIRRDDTFVISPSVSPENTYRMKDGTEGHVCENSTMDVSILRELLVHYLEAQRILTECGRILPDSVQHMETSEKAREILRHLPEIRIGRYGQIMEWQEDYEEPEPGHRHISQLYGLFPGEEISLRKTPELALAAKRTIERRLQHGGGYTGWSAAWLICQYAALHDRDGAEKMLRKLLTDSTADNLMDTHPRSGGSVFQIDGNLGATAGIINMLIQDDGEYLDLLPACPATWKNGRLDNVRLRGGARATMRWENGKVKQLILYRKNQGWHRKITGITDRTEVEYKVLTDFF